MKEAERGTGTLYEPFINGHVCDFVDAKSELAAAQKVAFKWLNPGVPGFQRAAIGFRATQNAYQYIATIEQVDSGEGGVRFVVDIKKEAV